MKLISVLKVKSQKSKVTHERRISFIVCCKRFSYGGSCTISVSYPTRPEFKLRANSSSPLNWTEIPVEKADRKAKQFYSDSSSLPFSPFTFPLYSWGRSLYRLITITPTRIFALYQYSHSHTQQQSQHSSP